MSNNANAESIFAQRVTGVDTGLRGEEQIRIALQKIVDLGGVADIQAIYDAVEAHMQGRRLSDSGKASLRYLINRLAVQKGYLHPWQDEAPGWRITEKGRQLLAAPRLPIFDETEEVDDRDEGDDERDEGDDVLARIAEWRSSIDSQHPFFRHFTEDFPVWLAQTFGGRTTFRGNKNQKFSVFIDGKRRLRGGRFRDDGGVYIRLYAPSARQVSVLERRLSRVDTLEMLPVGRGPDRRLIVYTDADYQTLKEIIVMPQQMVTARACGRESFYQAAEQFVDAALRTDASLFTAGVPTWTTANIESLHRYFVEHPDNSGDSFITKFQRQLAGAPGTTIQLAAEMLYVHYLIATNIGGKTKRQRIRTVLGWLPSPVAIPPELDRALDAGLANTGIAFLRFQPYQLAFLVEFARQWKILPDVDRNRLLNDPWAFKEMLFKVPIRTAYAQREALLHIVHPDTFEPIVSRAHKQQYAQKYTEFITEPTNDVDRKLHHIRTQMTQQHGPCFSFYSGPKPPISVLPRSLGEKLQPYVELVAGLDEPSYIPEEIVEHLVRISPPDVPLQTTPAADELVADLQLLRLLEQLEDGRYRRWEHLRDATIHHMLRYAALTLLAPDLDETDAYTLPVLNAPFDGREHLIADWPVGDDLLRWYEEAGLVQRMSDGLWQSLPGALEPVDSPTPTAQALNTFLDHVRRVRSHSDDLPPLGDGTLPQLDLAMLDARIAEIQRELLIDRTTILRIYRALIAGHHVILSGPPGTGKTHLARLLPRVLWRDQEQVVRLEMPADPALPPTAPLHEERLGREGYAVEVVTATEDWGVRHVVGGIVPQMQRNGGEAKLVYGVRHGALTRALLHNYAGYDGVSVPELESLRREEYITDGGRYRGLWLVIDEFTRAPIDAAFGGLLTTLGGQRNPTLDVPTDAGIDLPVPLPRDFRLIGTLNSFDRHFLNQISEAMKRRFTFIDILPPERKHADTEQCMAIYHALLRLADQGVRGVDVDERDARPSGFGVTVQRTNTSTDPDVKVGYKLTADDDDARLCLDAFWRIFSAIRVYRQLGTAQAESVYAALFAGPSIGMSWRVALDSALADVLADQLQVLARDEQRVLLELLHHSDDPKGLASTVTTILSALPVPRRTAHLLRLQVALQAEGGRTIDSDKAAALDDADVQAIYGVGDRYLDNRGLFARRLQSFVHERGL